MSDHNLHIRWAYITSADNYIADALSRGGAVCAPPPTILVRTELIRLGLDPTTFTVVNSDIRGRLARFITGTDTPTYFHLEHNVLDHVTELQHSVLWVHPPLAQARHLLPALIQALRTAHVSCTVYALVAADIESTWYQ